MDLMIVHARKRAALCEMLMMVAFKSRAIEGGCRHPAAVLVILAGFFSKNVIQKSNDINYAAINYSQKGTVYSLNS